MNHIIVGVTLILLGASGLYSRWLHTMERSYEPDRTIFTVIGGESLVGGAVALLCWYGVLPWIAFGMFGLTQATAAIPIAIWQIIQARQRARELNESSEGWHS